MTLYEFNSLEHSQQAEIVWESVLFDTRVEGEFKILLYQVHAFYIEVYYDSLNNKIVKFRSFSSLNQLDPYLENIKIDADFLHK